MTERQRAEGRLTLKRKRTHEELKKEAEKKWQELTSKVEDRTKKFKWQKRPFLQQTRRDRLALSHYRHAGEPADRINKYFSRFNTKSRVITYASDQEYHDAKLDQLPSSTSWSKEETDCLMYLCQKFNLRFLVIADRFS